MEATRVRFEPLLEWVCAAIVIVGLAGAAMFLVRDMRDVRVMPVTPVMAHEAPAVEPSPVVPSRAVAVPMMLLEGGRSLRLGQPASEVERTLGADAQRGQDAVDRDGARERITRFYEAAGTRFAVVFAAPRVGAEPLVVAMYRW